MTVALQTERMSRAEFFAWAITQERRYEFDGVAPVAMTGGTFNHDQICHNLWAALRRRLRGGACTPAGPNAGLATVGEAVRYPDALVTCSKVPGDALLIPGVIVVFEVLSPSSGWTDRIAKLQEYRAVPSIRRYVILEHASAALTVFERASADAAWTAQPLMQTDILVMPEIGIEVPVAEFYDEVELPLPPG